MQLNQPYQATPVFNTVPPYFSPLLFFLCPLPLSIHILAILISCPKGIKWNRNPLDSPTYQLESWSCQRSLELGWASQCSVVFSGRWWRGGPVSVVWWFRLQLGPCHADVWSGLLCASYPSVQSWCNAGGTSGSERPTMSISQLN